jgi:hypothetical protein
MRKFLKRTILFIRGMNIMRLMLKENFLFDPKEDVYIIKLMQTGIRLKLSDKEISKAIINKHRVYP